MTSSNEALESVADQEPVAPIDEVFRGAERELLSMLYYVTGNLEDARDALQETFVKCWRNRHQCDQVRDLKAWVFRIAMNTGRDLRRTAWNKRRRTMPKDDVMISKNFTPDVAVEQKEELELLRLAILDLRPEEQEVLLLRQNGSMTYEQIAQTIDVPIGTVKTRMRAALHKLNTTFAER